MHFAIEKIMDICNIENIRLIVPTIDTELLVLAENKKNIESKTNAKVLISNYDVINICRNKINTQMFFEKNNFGVPRLITNSEIEKKQIRFPIFIKPIDGSSSINTFKIDNMEQLKFFEKYVKKPMIQEFIKGIEFTVDVFCDFNSNPITIATS